MGEWSARHGHRGRWRDARMVRMQPAATGLVLLHLEVQRPGSGHWEPWTIAIPTTEVRAMDRVADAADAARRHPDVVDGRGGGRGA